MRVLVIGDMRRGANSRSVAEGYKMAGHDVRWIDISPPVVARKGSALWHAARNHRSVTPGEQNRVREAFNLVVAEFRPELLVCIKTVLYDQSLFVSSPVPVKVHLSFDDVSNPDNTSKDYLDKENLWDLIVTTKRHNVEELFARGARDVLFVWGAFDPRYRKRITPTDDRRFDLGFIGAARPDRLNLPIEFARALPGRGAIYGPRWRRHYPIGKQGVKIFQAATAERYTTAANSIKIGLVLLNSENRDLHTNRSFETPATGQLMLGERTSEHLEVFDEGVNALLFDGREELWQTLDRLCRSPSEVRRIADEGHRMITAGGFSYEDRARELVQYVEG